MCVLFIGKMKYNIDIQPMRGKDMKKIISLLLAVSMLVCVSGCSRITTKTIQAEMSESAAEEQPLQENTSDLAEEQPAQAEPAEAETAAQEQERPEILHLEIGKCTEGIQYYDEEGNYIRPAEVCYPMATLSEEETDKYPELASTLAELNEGYRSSAVEALDGFYSTTLEDMEYGRSTEYTYYENTLPELRRADSVILSILKEYKTYGGGSHGYGAYMGDNIDPQTGKLLSLSDVVTDMDAFIATVLAKFSELYPDVSRETAAKVLEEMKETGTDTVCWTMDYFGVTVYFNPYNIAAYSQGIQIVTVPFNEAQQMFEEKYLNVPDNFIQQINGNVPVVADINGDGINETVLVISESAGEDEDYYTAQKIWTVCFGDKETVVNDYCYSGEFYLVCSEGRYYVYIIEVADNDYSMLTVVDLQSGENNRDKIFNASCGGGEGVYDGTEDSYSSLVSWSALTDPEDMLLSSRLAVLGTMGGERHYKTGADGWPEAVEDYYLTSTEFAMTAKTDIDCITVDGDGEKTGNASIIEGRYYQTVRTDGESWVDIQELDADEVTEYDNGYTVFIMTESISQLRADRPIYRLDYIHDEWPGYVQGIIEEDVFEGLMYAG